jgi:hypothetical protein
MRNKRKYVGDTNSGGLKLSGLERAQGLEAAAFGS